MTYIGVSGHQNIPDQARAFIVAKVRGILTEQDRPLVGYSSLAEGADQLVAKEVLNLGGSLHAIIPSENYGRTFQGSSVEGYRQLLKAASRVEKLPFRNPTEEAFDAAGKWIAEHCTVLIAIWDGKPARGLGGTADAVAYALAHGRDVRIVWPEGVMRD